MGKKCHTETPRTHNQEMIKVRKETKEEIGENTRGLIKEFRQVKQTIEKCESW